MIYKAYLKQSGEGCDYTIGCGQTVISLKATSTEEAVEELYREIEENYTGESELESCELYFIDKVVVYDNDQLYGRSREAKDKARRELVEEFERLEFERLKAKYDKNNFLCAIH